MGFNVGGIALTSPGTTLSVDSGVTNWMKVNASGVLTRPQTPYMRGTLTGLTGYISGVLPVTAAVNFGGYWNDATSTWTCPVAGYYMVTGGGIGNTQAGYFSILKNGGGVYSSHWNHTTTWHYASVSGIVICSASDTITFLINGTTPATGVGFYGNGGHGMYSIALMA